MKLSMSDDYNEHSRSQSSLWELARDGGLLDDALVGIARREGGAAPPDAGGRGDRRAAGALVVRAAELGCATGGNSLGPLSRIARAVVPGGGTDRLEVLLVDRPENHWEVVAATVTPAAIRGAMTPPGRSDADPSSSPRISVTHVPRCFYRSCAEDASLDVSYSFSAAHWMRAAPDDGDAALCPAVFPTCPASNPRVESLEAWRSAARTQLREFAASRRRELRIGGRFLGSFVCLERGKRSNAWSRVGILARRAATERLSRNDEGGSWPGALADALLSGGRGAGTLPIAFRGPGDLREAFAEADGWRMLRCEYALAGDPLRRRAPRDEAAKRSYARDSMDSWKAACLEGLVASTTASGGVSTETARDFWDAVCRDCAEMMVRECDDSVPLEDQYHLDIPAYFVLAERVT